MSALSRLDELSTVYLEHLVAERIFSPNTVRARARALRAVGRPGTISREDLEAWWLVRAKVVSDVTRANDLAHLRGFYRWCQMFEHRIDDPSVRLSRPSVSPGLPRAIRKADLRHALQYVTEAGDDISRRAIALGAYAGLRISESAALMWDNVDEDSRLASVVRSKGKKSRLVKLSPGLLDMLLPNTGGNVVTGRDHALATDTLRARVNRALRNAGVDATSHQLRHYYGTVGYRASKDLVALGRQMGHANVNTTMVYAAASDDVADVIANAVLE